MVRWTSLNSLLTHTNAYLIVALWLVLGCGDSTGENGRLDPLPSGVADAAVATNLVVAMPQAWVPAVGLHPWTAEGSTCEPDYLLETYDGLEVIEIDTRQCKNQTLSQSLTRPIMAGTKITVVGFHFSLTSFERTQGHFALAIGDRVIVDEGVDIPSSSGGFERHFRPESTIPVGTTLYWHIHNHGANRWILVSMRTERDD